MKFKCGECGKTFMYASKKTHLIQTAADFSTTTGVKAPINQDVLQKHVCPYCGSLDFDECTEPQPEIVSVKRVNTNDADELIAQGYVVQRIDASTTTLVKREIKEEVK